MYAIRSTQCTVHSSLTSNSQQTVLNNDGSTTLVDLQTAVTPAAARQDDTQYVMVETPAGYQYVAVVMPEDGQQAGELHTQG